jgi:hypothetical protein
MGIGHDRAPRSITNGAKSAHSSSFSKPLITADLLQEEQPRNTLRRVGGIPLANHIDAT